MARFSFVDKVVQARERCDDGVTRCSCGYHENLPHHETQKEPKLRRVFFHRNSREATVVTFGSMVIRDMRAGK